MTFSAEEVRPVASYMRNVGKNQAADMLEAMTGDKSREAFERWAEHLGIRTKKNGVGFYLVEATDDMWSAWNAALHYHDEQEKQT